jgi:hypothetical protein
MQEQDRKRDFTGQYLLVTTINSYPQNFTTAPPEIECVTRDFIQSQPEHENGLYFTRRSRSGD